MEASTKVTPVTLDDVRAAIEGIDPNSTNASAVRKVLGRGSNDTIQRHLITLRTELIAQNTVPTDASDVPAMPNEAMHVVWASAYTTAAAKVSTRLAILSSERDNALARLTSAEQDIVALIADSDSANEAIANAAIEIETLKKAQDEALADAEAAAIEQQNLFKQTLADADARTLASQAETQTERNKVVETQHLLDLEKRDRATEVTVLNGTIDRLTQQVSDLKTLLAQLTLAK